MPEARVTIVDNSTALSLTRTTSELGGIEFSRLTLGRATVDSPVYVNPKRLIAVPSALQVAANLGGRKAEVAVAHRHHQGDPFELVADVLIGGLHVATAYSLTYGVPLFPPRTMLNLDIAEGLLL